MLPWERGHWHPGHVPRLRARRESSLTQRARKRVGRVRNAHGARRRGRGRAREARPWSFGERQALSLVVAGLPQPYLNEVFSIIGLGQTFPDGDRVVDLPRGHAACIRLRRARISASSPWRKPPTTRTRRTTRACDAVASLGQTLVESAARTSA